MEFPDLSNSRAAVRAFRKGFRSGEVALAKFEEVSFECEYEPAEEVIARELEEQARREEEEKMMEQCGRQQATPVGTGA